MQATLQTASARSGLEDGTAQPNHQVSGAAAMHPGKLAALTIQVALAVFLVRQFNIEGRGFLLVALLCGGGFVVHALLPFPYRLPFFVALSLAAAPVVLGAPIAPWLVGLSLLMIGLCYLPIAFPRRVLAVLLAGAALAVVRVGWVSAPWPRALWPIFGSMLMFRLIIYLYDLRHDASGRSIWQTLAYFFMLPNVCFALFPVVDYKTFRRTYYDDDAHQIYQVGVERITRGICHLLLYRAVYYYWTLAPSEVTSAWSLVQFLVTNFALYLRVSGLFHLIVGVLRLFGYNLPDTHNLYFLSSSIGDLWRRINIYWKDFMQKIVFYPAFFRFRRRGTTSALLLSTVCVVVMTWLLHSYQWFWIGGTFPVIWQDATFWGAIGVFMLLQNVYLENPQRAGAMRRFQLPLPRAVVHGLRIGATFALMCLLWSLWTCESFGDWVSAWSVLGDAPLAIAVGVTLAVAVIYLATVVMLPLTSKATDRALSPLNHGGTHRPFWQAAGMTSVVLVGLGLVSLPRIYLQLGRRVSSVVHTLQEAKLNRLDAAKMQLGYYQGLFNTARLDSPLWEVQAMEPADWVSITRTRAAHRTDDMRFYTLVPSTALIFKGAPLHTNHWGMRDQEYTREKPAGTYRIAILGSSYEMGAGVADDETFEAVLERRLNKQSGTRRYQLLNFAVGGYSPLQELAALERTVFAFHPDAVFYFAHDADFSWTLRSLVQLAHKGITPPYPYLRNLLSNADVERNTPRAMALRRLRRRETDILRWTYRRIVELCRAHGAKPVWIFLPTTGHRRSPRRLEWFAREAGFTTLSLAGVYGEYSVSQLSIVPWDHHPNALGHELIARRLYTILEQRPDLLGAGVANEHHTQHRVER